MLSVRHDISRLSTWWWTIDRWIFISVLTLMGWGLVMMLSATPAVAHRLHLSTFYFVKRAILFSAPSLLLMVLISMLRVYHVKRLALGLFVLFYILLLMVPFLGETIKGAKRWISCGLGFSLQPSELIKPSLTILVAWMFSLHSYQGLRMSGSRMAWGLYGLVMVPVCIQPDLGMGILISSSFLTQAFLAGLSIRYLLLGCLGGCFSLWLAYMFVPHVHDRVQRFLDPGANDCYQIQKSLEGFMQGGFWGQGPGEGLVKYHLPDAHADFVFSVMGEEFGLIACILVSFIFLMISMKGFISAFKTKSLFVLYAASGLLVQLGLQALINMASTLNLIPTKGMALPFISYGGSSCLSLAMTIGFLLSLLREHTQNET